MEFTRRVALKDVFSVVNALQHNYMTGMISVTFSYKDVSYVIT